MAIGAYLGAKMAPSWPTWCQDVPKMANLEAKMANLAHFWEHLGDLFWILGAILPKMAKTKKMTTDHHFGRFFLILGAVLEAKLAHLGAMLGHVGAILEQLGDEMGLKSAKMSQESGQERQDEPRWRNHAEITIPDSNSDSNSDSDSDLNLELGIGTWNL